MSNNYFMERILDANLNRATEALRVLEEIARFYLDDGSLSAQLKKIRHSICTLCDKDYEKLLKSRDTQGDVGVNIENPSKRNDIMNVFRANIKRLQQALRVLAEYAPVCGYDLAVFERARYDSYELEKTLYERLMMNINKYRLQDKKLYLVTNSDKFEDDNAFIDAVAAALKGGVQIVQLREKNSSAKRIVELAKRIRELTAHYNALFIVNDRVDIVQIVDADGVHIGQDDVDIKYVREILGEAKIIGVSTHAPEQALKAVDDGADYIGVGPVFATPTKQGRIPVGLEYVKWASDNINIPFYAIGGIDLENIDEVLENGAVRAAVVRAIQNSDTPESAAKAFLDKLS